MPTGWRRRPVSRSCFQRERQLGLRGVGAAGLRQGKGGSTACFGVCCYCVPRPRAPPAPAAGGRTAMLMHNQRGRGRSAAVLAFLLTVTRGNLRSAELGTGPTKRPPANQYCLGGKRLSPHPVRIHRVPIGYTSVHDPAGAHIFTRAEIQSHINTHIHPRIQNCRLANDMWGVGGICNAPGVCGARHWAAGGVAAVSPRPPACVRRQLVVFCKIVPV